MRVRRQLRPVAPRPERRREVERHLAAHGLLPGVRRLGAAPAGPPDRSGLALRLREALPELGPVFASFGLYLSTRADLFELSECALLAGIPDRGEPLAPAVVEEILAAELRPEPFVLFEQEPLAARLLFQTHRAWPGEGRQVVVRIARPDLEAEAAAEVELLALLRPAFPARGFAFEEVVADFRRSLAARLDFRVQAEAFDLLSLDTEGSDLAAVPRVYRDLSTARILTLDWLDGLPLEQAADGAGGEPAAAHDLARRLCLLWLRLALTCRRFPVEADLLRRRDGRIAVIGGTFSDPAGASQLNLWAYLRGTAVHDPDLVFECLSREVTAGPRAVPWSELRKRLRQAVPIREEALSAGGESLAEHLLAHWRIVRGAGYRPLGYLQDFYRGLFRTAGTARRIAPAGDTLRDPLREAFDDLQWLAGWSQMRQLADPRKMVEAFEGYLTTMSVLPQQVERALQVLGREAGGRSAPAEPPPRERSSSAVVIALGMAMASLVLLTIRFSALPGRAGDWVEAFGALGFLLLGALVLRAAGGRRR
ncbi:MAG TPA: AarF/UbiB family protein [Thermoanaerobaculia bacterium]|jgi:ubiquinone biosynthesis protein